MQSRTSEGFGLAKAINPVTLSSCGELIAKTTRFIYRLICLIQQLTLSQQIKTHLFKFVASKRLWLLLLFSLRFPILILVFLS